MFKKSVLRFTLKELNALIQDEKSHVVLQRCIRKMPLQPYCLNDLPGSIREELDANLAKFDHELKGILLSYKNIKILKNVANMLHDDSRLYVTIQADFYLFMPEVGHVLRGIVNKRSADHIGCLVHKAFNVSIPRPESEEEDWQGYYVEIGQEITFRVDSLDLTGSLPYMLGHLLDVGTLSSTINESFSEGRNLQENNVSDTYECDGLLKRHQDLSPTGSIGEHKKKKKHKLKNSTDLEDEAYLSDHLFKTHRGSISVSQERREEHLKNEIRNLHEEYGGIDSNFLKTVKKKKRKSAEQIHIPSRGEHDREPSSPDGIILDQNLQDKEQREQDGQVFVSQRHVNVALESADRNSFSDTSRVKKKKRKYSEAFYDIEHQREGNVFSPENECISSKPKKKKRKEKQTEETSDAAQTIERTQEFIQDTLAHQEKKKKKKKRTDSVEDTPEDFNEKKISDRTVSPSDNHRQYSTILENPLTACLDPYNLSEENEIAIKKAHFKKTAKKAKSNTSLPFATSTPAEYRDMKQSISNIKDAFSTPVSAHIRTDFEQSGFSDSEDNTSLLQSPPIKAKKVKKERKISSLLENESKPLKLNKRNKIISEEGNFKYHDILYPTENIPTSLKAEHLIRGKSTDNDSYVKAHTSIQGREHNDKEGEFTERYSKHLIKRDVETTAGSKSKVTTKNGVKLQKREHLGSTTKMMQTDSNDDGDNSNGDQHCGEDYDDTHERMYFPHMGELRSVQPANRIADLVNNKKQQSAIRKSVVSRGRDSIIEMVEDMPGQSSSPNGGESHSKNPLRENRNSSKRTLKYSKNTEISQLYSQDTQISDRVCSPDSGFSISTASRDRESSSSTICGSKKEIDSVSSTHHRRNSLEDESPTREQMRTMARTPIQKDTPNSERSSSQPSVECKIKTEKKSPSSKRSSSKKSETTDSSLEVEKLKLLAAAIKKLEDGSQNEFFVKSGNDVNKSSSSIKSTHKVKRKRSEEESLPCSDEHSTPSSRNAKRRKMDSKICVTEYDLDFAELENKHLPDSTDKSTNSKKAKLVNCEIHDAKDETDPKNISGERHSLKDEIPIRRQSGVLAKTPRRRNNMNTEENSTKSTANIQIKIKKEKESPKKVTSSADRGNKERKLLIEESPDAIAERLLQEFLKNRSM